MMTHTRWTVLLAAAALAGACSSSDVADPVTGASQSSLRLVNASAATATYSIDNDAAIGQLPTATVSTAITLPAGTHQLRLVASNASISNFTFQTTSGQTSTAVVTGTASAISATTLADTGAVVPAGKSKLRVSNLSQNPAIEIWRTQPDYQTPIHIMTPFVYQATSPYLQSDPGDWEVFVTAAGGTAKLVTTGPVTVPNGERRTVVLLDSAGLLRLRVLPQ